MGSLLGDVGRSMRGLVKNQGKPPVQYASPGRFQTSILSALSSANAMENYMAAVGVSATVYSVVSTIATAVSKPNWKLYRKAKQDGRQRYTTNDQGSDMRVEVTQHQALKVWTSPNEFYTNTAFVKAFSQHRELTGEAYWLVEYAGNIPVGLWPVRPDRMTPVPGSDTFIAGYVYGAPDGSMIPFRPNEVIMMKDPNPVDPYHGLGPVQSILVHIDSSRYSAEWNRAFFLNGAQPNGVLQTPNEVSDPEFQELENRWRESHQGVSRAHRVALLENGVTWQPTMVTQKDMDFINGQVLDRDMILLAWGIHKHIVGVADDVNRANAITAEEIFQDQKATPRLDDIKDTLNNQFLPLFYPGATPDVEFDYANPRPVNREADALELKSKAQSALWLAQAGFDQADIPDVVGLPGMRAVKPPLPAPGTDAAAGSVPDGTAGATNLMTALTAKKNVSAKVYQQLAKDYPVGALGWVHYAEWMGPLNVPLNHIDMTGSKARFGRTEADIDQFRQQIQDKGKTKPVILVKRPDIDKLLIVDGHARVLAYSDQGLPVRAFIGAVAANHGDWDSMHDNQLGASGQPSLDSLMRQMVLNGRTPLEIGAAP